MLQDLSQVLRRLLDGGLQADTPARDANRGERWDEQLRSQLHKAGTAAPAPGQGFRFRIRADLLDHGVYQGRVGAPESEDRLLLVAHPDAALRDGRKPEEDRELDGAGVLELVHEHQVQLVRKPLPDIRAVQQLEGVHLLVGEIDYAVCLLVGLVLFHRAPGQREHQVYGRGHVGTKAGMPVVRRCSLLDFSEGLS